MLSIGICCTGCGAIRDSVAWMIGAPSTKQIATEQKKLQDAETRIADLDERAAAAEHARAAIEAERAAALERGDNVLAVYATLAGQLRDASGGQADALMNSLAALQAEWRASRTGAGKAASLAAGYDQQLAEIKAAQERGRQTIADAEANLLGFQDATAAAISGATGFVTLAGQTAAGLGVPGAQQAADQIAAIGRVGLDALLLGGAVWGTTRARKRRVEADTARTEAADAERSRDRLARVVQAVDEFGLLKDDPAAREAAKRWVGADAHRELKLTLANGATP